MRFIILILTLFALACSEPPHYDIVIKNGTLYDGTGTPGSPGDLAISGDSIVKIGELGNYTAEQVIDAAGKAVSPGFINMLSWANVSLLVDGRSQGDIRQGVTLEVLGEGTSMGPINERMREAMKANQQHLTFDPSWNTLGEYLEHLERTGISTNVASFIGNGTLRNYVIGYEPREATASEIDQMKALLEEGMQEGAMGISTSLIYVPSGHASTEEIVELAKVASQYDGMYISHIRDEEGGLLQALDELIRVADEADIRSEVYHFKASGTDNWDLMDPAIAKIDSARAAGLDVTTDMYMYPASSTGLNVILPEWAKEGGLEATLDLFKAKRSRQKIMDEMDFHVPPEKILLVGFRQKSMRKYIGKTLAEVAEERGLSPEETVVALIEEDGSRIQVVYFSMSEENLHKKLKLPYMAICSDAGSYTNEGVFLEQSTHPRAYGSFARLLAHYVREKNIISLEEAIHRMTGLPAANLKLKNRGLLQPGNFADIVIFDPETIQDQATFEEPHQYATGVSHVLVNGKLVIEDGEHTGATPGRVVRGPGYMPQNQSL